jgi:AcrR family transcriptional regulator
VSTPIAAKASAGRTPDPRKEPIGRQGWLDAARTALIREGIAGVKVGKIARRLKVTRGGFYWFFDSHRQLLDELLLDWEQRNTEGFKSVLRESGRNGMAEFQALVDIWLNEKIYSPAWDAAVRDWARVSSKVANAVRRTDDARIGVLKQVFLDMGCEDEEAFVRARVCYFHQVGYYTLGMRESREERLRLLPLYTRVLTGRKG